MLSHETKNRWYQIVESASMRSDLTKWEDEFIDSISMQMAFGQILTRAQSKSLYSIAHKYGL